MSKLDTLAGKIAEKIMPKMRRMIREELDYALEKNGTGKVINDKTNTQQKSVNEVAKEGDYSKVAQSFKSKFQNINGDSVVDPNETFTDENGKTHQMGDLMRNENAQKVMENINKDYSDLID